MTNKEIKQICQQINSEDILNKKFFPVWFFINERINYLFSRLENKQTIKTVFSIGGGGDFAFSLLSSPVLKAIKEINLCDFRSMACVSIDFKIALFKCLKYEEALDLFLEQRSFPKQQTYREVRKFLTNLSKKIFDFIIEDCPKNDFLICLKKSGWWYQDSFWQIKHRSDYLPYISSQSRYHQLQNSLDRLTIYSGDFNETLKLFPNEYYDLIYTSNIFDSPKYCRELNLYLQTIKEKLGQDGWLLVVTQDRPERIIELINQAGFHLIEKKLSRFSLISSLKGHYSYSFLLFQSRSFD